MAKANMSPSLYYQGARTKDELPRTSGVCHAFDSFCCNLASVSKALRLRRRTYVAIILYRAFRCSLFRSVQDSSSAISKSIACTLSHQKHVWRAPSGCVRSGTREGGVWCRSPRAARGVESNHIKSNRIKSDTYSTGIAVDMRVHERPRARSGLEGGARSK